MLARHGDPPRPRQSTHCSAQGPSGALAPCPGAKVRRRAAKKKQPLFLLDGRDGFAGVFDLGQRAHGDRSRVADALAQLRANLINVLNTPGVGNATRDGGIERGEVRERELPQASLSYLRRYRSDD